MISIKNIITGWYRKLRKIETSNSEARLKICKSCPNKVKLGDLYFCEACGCEIEAKSKVEDEKCLLGKWND